MPPAAEVPAEPEEDEGGGILIPELDVLESKTGLERSLVTAFFNFAPLRISPNRASLPGMAAGGGTGRPEPMLGGGGGGGTGPLPSIGGGGGGGGGGPDILIDDN